MATKKFAPKLPLELDDNGNFIKIDNSLENVKQKLKTIILTNPGEKLMDPEFGVGVRRYLFEPDKGIINYNFNDNGLQSIRIDNFKEVFTAALNEQIYKYSSDIAIYGVNVEIDEQVMYLSIEYNYKGFMNDTLELTVNI